MENGSQEKILQDLQSKVNRWLPAESNGLSTFDGIRESIRLLKKRASEEIAHDMSVYVDYSMEGDPGKNAVDINKLIDDLKGLLPVDQTK